MKNNSKEFSERLGQIDQNKIKEYLLSLNSPCYESELLKIAFPEYQISNNDPLLLYQNHFLLFHVLYKIKKDFYNDGKYLHIHFMRIFLQNYPGSGKCRYYDEHIGRFCETDNEQEKNYCAFHLKIIGELELEELSSQYFYLDDSNYFKLDEETAEAFIKGTWETLRYYDEYKESLRILDIPESADINMIKKKFRALAKKYHPDLGEESHEKFNEINRAYRLLVQLRSAETGFNNR